ncbi:thioesterase family protein [Corynebacterium dentalis]|uniref:thioesterase family protein n=1 Tax=Corynebacterium dentalis TaxID=2014528 RepID=UPI002899D033|nr:thioesterase family protein [Corynebacterium dentalis]
MTQNTSRHNDNVQDSPESYFTLDHVETVTEGDNSTKEYRFTATELTASPWGQGFQHGSPPAALIAYLLEVGAHDAGLSTHDGRYARMSVDLLGAVPLGTLFGRITVIRPGRRISLLEAVVSDAQGRQCIRGRGWWLTDRDTTEVERSVARRIPGPEQGTPATQWLQHWSSGYIDSIDAIQVELPDNSSQKHDDFAPGNAYAYWARSSYPTVAGSPETPWTQLMRVVDIANGLNPELLSVKEWTYMNVDMSVYLHRMPVGEWTGILAEANYGPDGIGTTVARIYDTSGPIGSVNQAIMLAPVS